VFFTVLPVKIKADIRGVRTDIYGSDRLGESNLTSMVDIKVVSSDSSWCIV